MDAHQNAKANVPDLRRVGLHPNFWYPLAQSKDLKPGKTLAVSYGGEAIVLVRTETGKVYALEDRCAHRQMPLSCGVVEGEKLKCCYHAWSYDASGRCASIPYLRKGQEFPRGVRAFACREAYNHIFVFPGDQALVDKISFPEIPTWGVPTHKTMYFSRQVPCHYSFMHENLFDMNHQFLHRRLMGGIKATLLETRRGEDWVEIDYKFERTGGKQHKGAGFLLGEKAKDPSLRNYDIMRITTKYPYQLLTVTRPGATEPAFNLWVVYVPVDREQRVHHSFGMLMIKRPKIPFVLNLIWPIMRYFTESVFAEDRFAVEAEQRAHDLQGADWNQEIFPPVIELRELLIRHGVPLDKTGRLQPSAGLRVADAAAQQAH